MANFTAAINALVCERDRVFIERVSTDYNLDLAELTKKYLETAEEAIKVPRKYKKRDVKLVEVDGEKVEAPSKKETSKEKKTCEAQTSKKEPCKFSALKGGCFCKRHQRQNDEEKSGEPVPKKEKKAPVKKQEQPLHTHALNESADGCNLCESHGNPLTNASDDFELVMPEPEAIPSTTVVAASSRLAALLQDEESESEEVTMAEPESGDEFDATGSDYEEED